MYVRILDALAVERDRLVLRPRGRRARAALSLLVMRANRVVPISELIGAVWDEPPETARQQIHIVVSRLRELLGPDHERILVTAAPGYLLRLADDESDLAMFERLVHSARAAAAAGDPALAATRFREALGLWRGPALAELPSAVLRAHAVRLAELHLRTLEERIDADLSIGNADALVAELTGLVAAHPYRERLRGQLMIALYRAGRQADALEVYRDGRRRLQEDIGVEPGTELQQLELAVLTGAGWLTPAQVAPAQVAPPVTTPAGRNDLPPDVPALVGRESEVQQLLAAGDPRMCGFVAVDGMGGVGKTALAVHVAHQLAERYPDAVLFVSLHGHSTSRRPMTALHALGVLLRSLGVNRPDLPPQLDERASLWRATAAGKRMLVVLDDAINAAQVRPLIAAARGCLTIVTSRRRLSSVDWTLSLSLGVLGAEAAGALFAERVGVKRAWAEPAAVRDVVRLCGRLPLALCAAGARVRHRPTWTVRDLAERLHDEQTRLTELSVGERSIAGSLRLSYDHLAAAQQRILRLLATLPGDEFSAAACAAAAGGDAIGTERTLEELVDVHLVQSGVPGRYDLHDLVRQFARTMAGTDDDAPDRLIDYQLVMAVALVDLLDAQRRRFEPLIRHRLQPGAMPTTIEAAAAWLDRERANLVETVRWAYEHGRLTQCWQLACALWPYFHFGKHTDDWLATHDYALRASLDLRDTAAEALVREQLGVAYWMANRDTEAAHHNQRALALYRQSGDPQGQGAVLGMLGRIAARAGRYPDALRQFAASLELLRQAGDRVEEAHVLNSTAILRYRRGEVEQASAAFGAALVLFRAVGDGRSEARVLDNLGYIELSAGRFGEALELFERALRLRERLMDRRPSQLLNNLALAYRGLGRTHDALRHHLEALESSRQADDERGECEVLNDLAETLIRLDRTAEARSRYEEALELAVRCADPYQQARAHEGIASLDEGGDPLGHLRRAVELYESLGVPDAARVRARTDG